MSYTGKIDTSSTQDGSCLIQVKSIPLAHRMADVLFTLFVFFQHILCCVFALFFVFVHSVASFSGLSIFD